MTVLTIAIQMLFQIDAVRAGLEKYRAKLASPTNSPSGPSKALVSSAPSGRSTMSSSKSVSTTRIARISMSSRLVCWRTGHALPGAPLPTKIVPPNAALIMSDLTISRRSLRARSVQASRIGGEHAQAVGRQRGFDTRPRLDTEIAHVIHR